MPYIDTRTHQIEYLAVAWYDARILLVPAHEHDEMENCFMFKRTSHLLQDLDKFCLRQHATIINYQNGVLMPDRPVLP